MATRTRRRARTVQEGLVGKDEFRVLAPGGRVLAVKGLRPLALIRAQDAAMRALDPIELTVERRSPFGDPTQLYRVVRDEHGVVRTFPVDPQD